MKLFYKQNQNQGAVSLARDYFQIEDENNVELMEALARINALPEDIEQKLRRHPDFDLDVDLDWVESANKFCNLLLSIGSQPAQSFAQTFDNSTLLSLRYAASKIARFGEPVPPEEVIKLAQALDQLNAAIHKDTNLTEPLRDLLLRVVFEAQTSVRLFDASGTSGLEDAYEHLIGALGRLVRQGNLDDVPNSLKERIWGTLIQIETVLSIGVSGFTIGSAATPLFGIST